MKRNKQFDELVARIPQETKERVWKQMSCKWYRGGDCGKGLPGTPCNVVGCAAWVEYNTVEKAADGYKYIKGKVIREEAKRLYSKHLITERVYNALTKYCLENLI